MIDSVPDFKTEMVEPPPQSVQLAPAPRAGRDGPEGYLPDDGLANAMRVSVLLRRPLLLTGEPGTGKTKAADYMCWRLGHGREALKFDAKSTSTARDLFYIYNTVGRFLSPHVPESSKNAADYITYNALGMAIIRAARMDGIEHWLPNDFMRPVGPVQSVVLIDEIDKAPRDFPNDVLNEVEHMFFRVPEFANVTIRADEGFEPVLVITSNSEKSLPAAFIRRCVYYDIPRPDKNRFGEILARRVGVDHKWTLMNDALDFLMFLRSKDSDLRKKPSTSELLDWVMYLRAHDLNNDSGLREHRAVVEASLSALIKDEGRDGKELFQAWLKKF